MAYFVCIHDFKATRHTKRIRAYSSNANNCLLVTEINNNNSKKKQNYDILHQSTANAVANEANTNSNILVTDIVTVYSANVRRCRKNFKSNLTPRKCQCFRKLLQRLGYWQLVTI